MLNPLLIYVSVVKIAGSVRAEHNAATTELFGERSTRESLVPRATIGANEVRIGREMVRVDGEVDAATLGMVLKMCDRNRPCQRYTRVDRGGRDPHAP